MTRTIPKTVAIIGAGPCGAGAAKAFIEEGDFEITIFEKRSGTGGLWNYTTELDAETTPIPCESHTFETSSVFNKEKNEYIWPSPVYDSLDTNVPKDIMSYNGIPFPSELPLFPHRSDVCKYMKDFAAPLEKYIRFNTKIISIERDETDTKWVVVSRPVVAETEGAKIAAKSGEFQDSIDEFDAVVIATGNYDVPYIPHRDGMEAWTAKYPHSIDNVKNYRSAKQFEHIKGNILVVGNSASANDLCFQLTQDLKREIYKLKRSENVMPAGSSQLIKEVPDIKRFDAETKEVHFIDGSKLENVDKIVFATGYLLSLPFFKKINAGDKPLLTDGRRVHGIYEHILLHEHPNLAIIGLARYILPTRTAETQGSWAAKIFAGKLPYPSKEKMLEWESERVATKGDGKPFHDLLFPEDVHYCNRLNDQVVEANTGLIPFIWDREQISIRGSIKDIKEAYIKYRTATGKLALSYQELVESGYLKSFMLTDAELKEKGF